MENNYYIDRNEVLRYLGYRGQEIDDDLNNKIDNAIEEIKKISRPRTVYKCFDILKKDGSIILDNSSICLTGNDINEYLKNANKVVVMAATLGNNVDTRIRYYEKIDMVMSLILDSCASVMIEAVCDTVQRKINKEYNIDEKIMFRYSPGYGDLGLDCQRKVIQSLNANKVIGLTCTSYDIMIPRKSVTAFIAVISEITNAKNMSGCSHCNLRETCFYRMGGLYCGNNKR